MEHLKVLDEDFADGPVVKTSPSNAEGAGLIPGQGTKIPHDAGKPSPLHPCATTREAGALQPRPKAAKIGRAHV